MPNAAVVTKKKATVASHPDSFSLKKAVFNRLFFTCFYYVWLYALSYYF
jgi:hypothetical protein